MNTKLLKQKILDLAIRGKLTQQLKSDGTAKDLLKQISEQKRESSSTLSSPRRRGSPSAQSEKTIIPLDKSEAPFEIPANWEWVRLGDVAALKGGKRVPAGKTMTTEPTSHIYIRVTDMRDGTIYDDDLHYVTDEIYEVIKNYTISKNDLYITIAGTIGRVGLVPDLFDGMNLTENALKITNVIPDKKYLMYALQSGFVQDYFESTYHQVAMPKLSLTNASKALLPLPPLAEQQRIVVKIEEAFAEIDSIENNKELLKTHIKQARQKILDLAIHGKLVPQNKADEPASVLLERITRDNPHYEKLTDVPFEIPDSWEWVKLTDIVEINPKNKLDDNLEVSFIPMNLIEAGYSNRHAQESRSWKDVKKGFTHFAENDVVLAKISPCFENKKSAIMRNLKNGYGAGTTELFVFRPLEVMLAHYLLWIVKSDNFIQAGTGNFSGVVGQQRLSREVIENYPIPLPPFAEQKRIVDRIEEIFASLDEISLHLV